VSGLDRRIAELAATARAWRVPEHAARAEAVARTLEHHALYTAETVAFALNQAMHTATESALHRWAGDVGAGTPSLVAVWTDDAAPLAGWRDLLAAVLSGHRAAMRLPETSPCLLPAFFQEAARRAPAFDVAFSQSWDALPEGTAVVLGTGSDAAMAALAARCDAAGVGPARRRLRGDAPAVAVLDGHETAEERIGLAEDVLLHAEARRRVRVVWAPAGHAPDALLDACSAFRELFPAPPALDGRLQMPRAFLKAAGTPHAWGDGFLVSRGAPEPQGAGHLRWSEYGDLAGVRAWLDTTRVGLLVAPPRVRARLGWDGPAAAPGNAHRPRLEGADPLDLLGAG
jgi:hypothetical protein